VGAGGALLRRDVLRSKPAIPPPQSICIHPKVSAQSYKGKKGREVGRGRRRPHRINSASISPTQSIAPQSLPGRGAEVALGFVASPSAAGGGGGGGGALSATRNTQNVWRRRLIDMRCTRRSCQEEAGRSGGEEEPTTLLLGFDGKLRPCPVFSPSLSEEISSSLRARLLRERSLPREISPPSRDVFRPWGGGG